MKTFAIIAVTMLVILGAHRAHAATPLQQFESEIAGPLRLDGYADAANICGLRSELWRDVFDQSFVSLKFQEFEKFQLHGGDLALAEDFIQSSLQSVVVRCADLVNSPMMDHLDQIEYRLTGGYH